LCGWVANKKKMGQFWGGAENLPTVETNFKGGLSPGPVC